MKLIKTMLTGAALLSGLLMTGQNGTLSPYSQFGYGLLRDNATASQQMMGGIGYGMNSGRQINVMNPASYARVDSMTFLFDMGVDMTFLWMNEKQPDGTPLKESDMGGGLNYVTMQFPVGKRLGMSVGILPYSSVGYSFGNTIDNGYSTRNGQGSINELYVGIAGRIVSSLSVGVNVSYLFGSTTNDIYAITAQGSSSLYSREMKVRDFHVDAGIQYTVPIGRTDGLTLGFVYSPGKALLGKLTEQAIDVSTSTTESTTALSLKHYFSLASTYGAGINYRHGQTWMVEGDFTYQPWSKAKYLEFDGEKPMGVTGYFANRWKVAAGGEYQPAVRGSYARRIQYRFGGYFSRDYMTVRQTATGPVNNVREFGISAGVGLPITGFKSILNIGIGWVGRRAYPNSLIKEDYLNITLGINFNESWFRKSRIY